MYKLKISLALFVIFPLTVISLKTLNKNIPFFPTEKLIPFYKGYELSDQTYSLTNCFNASENFSSDHKSKVICIRPRLDPNVLFDTLMVFPKDFFPKIILK